MKENVKPVYDGMFIKSQAQRLASAAAQAGTLQSDIIRETVGTLTNADIPQESLLAIVADGTKKFTADERKTQATAYQYASRLKGIVGACLFAGYVPAGNVNEMTAAATKALKERGIDWQNRKVDEVAAAKHDQQVSKAMAQEREKIIQNNPDAKSMTVAQLDDLVRDSLRDQANAAAMDKCVEAAEKFAAKMFSDQGADYATLFAETVLKAVTAMAEATEDEADVAFV